MPQNASSKHRKIQKVTKTFKPDKRCSSVGPLRVGELLIGLEIEIRQELDRLEAESREQASRSTDELRKYYSYKEVKALLDAGKKL